MSFNSLPIQNNQYGNYNYLLNGNFDRLDAFTAQITGALYWNAYKDAAAAAPVDGTGGSPSVIRNAVVTTGALRGLRSWTITKTGNAQGEGYSSDFLIDVSDQNRNLSISFDFSTGSAYTAGDLVVYVYDITNSLLVTPSNVSIPKSSAATSNILINFVTNSSSRSYRLIFHCAASNSTTTNWSVTLDNIRVTGVPQPLLPQTLTDSQATSLGLKDYDNQTSYNGGLTPTVTSNVAGWIADVCQFYPWQDQAGNWYMHYNIQGTQNVGTISTANLTISGITFANIGAGGWAGSGAQLNNITAAMVYVIATRNTAIITFQMSAGVLTPTLVFTGWAKLASKPTWAY